MEQWGAFMNSLGGLKMRKSISDNLGWSFCDDGQFTVKSVWVKLEDRLAGEEESFKRIWKGFVPPKIEIFVWQLLQGRVMVRGVMYRRGLIGEDNLECPMCGEQEETIDHLFLQCKWAWNIWTNGMKWWNVNSCIQNSVPKWWNEWCDLCPERKSKRAWCNLFFATVWSIWEARNERVFKDNKMQLCQVLDMVCFRVAWWFKNMGKGSKEHITLLTLNIAERCIEKKKRRLPRIKKWIPPVSDQLKFNVDGAFRALKGQSGIGGVLRDNNGKILCLFYEKVEFEDIISAELMAIGRACKLCGSRMELKDNNISVVSDSRMAVSWINSTGVGSWKHWHMIVDIRNSLSSMKKVQVEFGSREYNSCADFLAKKGADGEDNMLEWSLP